MYAITIESGRPWTLWGKKTVIIMKYEMDVRLSDGYLACIPHNGTNNSLEWWYATLLGAVKLSASKR